MDKKHLVEWRALHKLTQKAIAEQLKCSLRTVQNYEAGATAIPDTVVSFIMGFEDRLKNDAELVPPFEKGEIPDTHPRRWRKISATKYERRPVGSPLGGDEYTEHMSRMRGEDLERAKLAEAMAKAKATPLALPDEWLDDEDEEK
jgi:transcriptional regulator with XRE-family HTH domain